MQSKYALHLQVLVVVLAEEGSFLRAAGKLGMPPSSLTRKLSQLEVEIGTRLFDRTTRRLELTKAGRLFIPEAVESIQHAERAWELARHQSLLEHGPFRLGYSAYISSAVLPFLRRLHSSAKEESAIVFESTSTTQIVERVLRGELHAGVGVMPIRDKDVWTWLIGQEPFYLCLPRDHRLARQPAVTVKDMDSEMVFWIPRSVHQPFYDATVNYIHRIGVHPVFQEVRGAGHVIEFVAQGFGIGLVPRSAIRLARSGVVFKSLADRYLRIETALVVRKDQRMGSLQSFIDDLLYQLRAVKVDLQ